MGRCVELEAGPRHRARILLTDRFEGDFAVHAHGVHQRRHSLVDTAWTWLDQVHGAQVLTVSTPGEHAGASADAAVTRVSGAVLSVQSADCAPLVLVGPGTCAVVHAGWRGLRAGIVERTAEAVRGLLGSTEHAAPLTAWLGPCIGAPCYEFGATDLEAMVATFDDSVRACSSAGAPALDLAAAVRAALRRADVALVGADERCTACDAATCYSHRARTDTQRHTTAVWLQAVS